MTTKIKVEYELELPDSIKIMKEERGINNGSDGRYHYFCHPTEYKHDDIDISIGNDGIVVLKIGNKIMNRWFAINPKTGGRHIEYISVLRTAAEKADWVIMMRYPDEDEDEDEDDEE